MSYINDLRMDSNSCSYNAPITLSQTELNNIINEAYEKGKNDALKNVGITQSNTSNTTY